MIKRIVLLIFLSSSILYTTAQIKLFVAVNGSDNNPGTITKPFKTLEIAVSKGIIQQGKDIVIEIRSGSYDLENTIEISSAFYSLHSLVIRAYNNEKVIITGTRKINPQWTIYKNGIYKAAIDLEEAPDRLFMNGKTLNMARYPNYDSSARIFNGTAANAISDEKVKNWKNPAGGYIHALHSGEWGDFHYLITGKSDDGKLQYEGGWQNNRPSPMHKQYRFVENIFEELDAPGEWFYDKKEKILYLYPPTGVKIQTAHFAISHLTDLIHVIGSNTNPVKNISISNIQFSQNSRSFMLTKEPLLRSDWTVYRGAAILLDGTENITISNCIFSELGGNGIFLSNYNKSDTIKDNHIFNIGASAIAFVGNPAAVRSPAFQYDLFVPWNEMDFTAGPKTNDYPQYCFAEENLIHNIGTVEKQVAGVQIEMSSHITISHNSIYKTPRSGINIGDGCWGGHIIQYNDVFNTVLETGDHGAFNSWGRDRFWSPDRNIIDSIVAARPGIELLDVIDPIILRNNRFQCDHGWDIDLDDGSTNYQIYNNFCLSGGLKLREGYHRTVTNNVLINNSFHPHVWLKNSDDVFMHNIVTSPYAPILMNYWGKEIDSNFFLTLNGLTEAHKNGLDKNSKAGNAIFLNADKMDYRVAVTSAALTTGFKNFEMNFGVTLPELKKLAEEPPAKKLLTSIGATKGEEVEWLGAKFKNIETLGERSAAGLHDLNGALLSEIPTNSSAAKNKLRKGDVILKMNDQEINSISDLLKVYQSIKWMGRTDCIIIRNQSQLHVEIAFKE